MVVEHKMLQRQHFQMNTKPIKYLLWNFSKIKKLFFIPSTFYQNYSIEIRMFIVVIAACHMDQYNSIVSVSSGRIALGISS